MIGLGGLSSWAGRIHGLLLAGAALAILSLTAGPRVLPYQTYFVLSGSMEPTIPVGSVIVLLPAQAEELGIGDVITFARPDHPETLVTHRIVGLEPAEAGPQFVTKGDANDGADPWRVPVSGQGWRVGFAIPWVGYLLRAVQLPLARLALVVLPALGLGALALVRIWKPQAPAPA